MKIERVDGQEIAIIIDGIRFEHGGYNTMVNCEGNCAFKVITGIRPGGQNYHMDEAMANRIKIWLDMYASKLSSLGVQIPETKTEIIKSEKRFVVFITQDNVGNDLSKTINNKTKKQVVSLAKQIKNNFINKLQATSNLRPDGYLNVGADLKANNFCDNDQCLYLVDIFPPHIWVEGGNKKEEPIVEMFETPDDVKQIGVWKIFTPEGMLINTLTQLGGVAIQHWEIFKNELNFPEHLLDVDISKITPKDIYISRLLACEYGYQKGVSQTEILAFFKKTHFESMMAGKQMATIKNELLEMRG